MHFTCPVQSTKRIITKGRKHFLFHSKNFKNKIIPYDTTLRQTYRDDFYVRTWSRPALAQSSISENYKLSNVLNVKFGNFNFGVNKEHSKWAISKNKSVICFSDLNHTKSQKERGGSIVCFDDQRLHKIMKNAITKTD